VTGPRLPTLQAKHLALGLTALTLSLLLSYSLLSPAWQAPDELAHGDLAMAMLEVSGYPPAGERYVSERILASRKASDWSKDPVDRVLAEAPPRPRPPFQELGPDEPTSEQNAATQHPPFYYTSLAAFLAAATGLVSLVGTPSHDQVVFLMRLFNILLIAPVPWLVFVASRRIGLHDHGALFAAAATLTIPQWFYIGASINNDNAVILAFAVLTYLLARVLTGDLSVRTASLAGLTAAAASMSKVFGLVAIPWVVLAYTMVVWRSDERSRAIVPAAIASGIAVVGGGWWWIRNLLTTGALQPLVRERSPKAGFEPDLVDWVSQYPIRMMQSFWGNFGYLDVPIARWMAVVATGVALALVTWGVLRRSLPIRSRLILLMPVATIVLGNAVQHWATIYPRLGGFGGSQGRYLFAAIPPAALLVGATVVRRRRLASIGLVLTGGAVLHIVSIRLQLEAFWGLENGSAYAVRNVVAWSPLPTPVSLAVFAAMFLAAVWTGYGLLSPIHSDPNEHLGPQK